MQKSEQQGNHNSAIEQEATRGWLDLLESVQKIKQQQEDQFDQLRMRMTRNYKSLTAETNKQNHEEMAKKWIRENLEEAQLFIDRVVGIKGITEDPLKIAAQLEGECCGESNVIAANTEATLQAQFVDPEPATAATTTATTTTAATVTRFQPLEGLVPIQSSQPPQPLPRVSISSSIVPSSDELYGY
jgi:hypothetical protein